MKDIFTDLYNKVLGFFRQAEKKQEDNQEDERDDEDRSAVRRDHRRPLRHGDNQPACLVELPADHEVDWRKGEEARKPGGLPEPRGDPLGGNEDSGED